MKQRSSQRGFTLIELMIVVVIIALVMAGVGLSLGATQRVKLRSSCYLLMSAVRYAFSRAATQGTTVRISIEAGGNGLHLEETKDRVVLNPEDESGEGLRRSGDKEEEKEGEEEENEDGEAESKKDSFLDLSGSSGAAFSTSPFAGGGLGMELQEDGTMDMTGFMDGLTTGAFGDLSVSGFFGNADGYKRPSFKPLPGKRGKPRELEGDTVFKKVFTPHDPLPREDGRAFIYFFSRGMAEHAFIQLSDGGDRVYTIVVHPLSGKSVLYTEEIEPEDPLDELQEAEE